MSQFLETYTALAVCIAIAGVLLWPLRGKLGLDLNPPARSRATALWTGLTFLVGFALCIIFVAPHAPHTEFVKANQKLTADNHDLRNTRKRELLEVLVVYLGVGRRFETQLQNSSAVLQEMEKTHIKNWQYEVEMAVASSPYKDRVAILKDQTGVPHSKPPHSTQPGFLTIWKSVNTMNYRIQELIDYIQRHED
jgi:hypothetical protein